MRKKKTLNTFHTMPSSPPFKGSRLNFSPDDILYSNSSDALRIAPSLQSDKVLRNFPLLQVVLVLASRPFSRSHRGLSLVHRHQHWLLVAVSVLAGHRHRTLKEAPSRLEASRPAPFLSLQDLFLSLQALTCAAARGVPAPQVQSRTASR